MSDKIQKALNAAILCMLRPLARLLMSHGVAYGTFAEIARKAFVEEGFDYVARSGKRPTISNVSALTGLSRKETKRLRELELGADNDSSARYNRAVRVISGWVRDSRFHDSRGEPADLPLEGEGDSFASLVKDYSGDIPSVAMLAVLSGAGNVQVNDGRVTLKSRAYLPSNTPVEKINILGSDVSELIATIGHNLEDEQPYKLFQRKVSNTGVRKDAIEEFRIFSNLKSQALLEEYHDWLSAHQADPQADPPEQPGYVAVGIYFVQTPDTES